MTSEKYLLIMHAEEQGYWDTSGYCHWKKEAVFREREFELEDKEDLIEAIGTFKCEYPEGEVSIYIIRDLDWDSEENQLNRSMIDDGQVRAKELDEIEKKKKKEKALKDRQLAAERDKQAELAQLRKLQEKYKDGK